MNNLLLASHVPTKRPNTEAGLLSTLASPCSVISWWRLCRTVRTFSSFWRCFRDYFSKLLKDQTSPHILLASGAAAAISSGFEGLPLQTWY